MSMGYNVFLKGRAGTFANVYVGTYAYTVYTIHTYTCITDREKGHFLKGSTFYYL